MVRAVEELPDQRHYKYPNHLASLRNVTEMTVLFLSSSYRSIPQFSGYLDRREGTYEETNEFEGETGIV